MSVSRQKGMEQHMYFVDREKIGDTLQFIERQLLLLEGAETWETAIEKAALERICHTVIEGIIDVGNALIDGFIMRDPGSYEDIIDILEDEKVITKEMSKGLKEIILFRKSLVQAYIQVDHLRLQQAFIDEMSILKSFPERVRQYLVDELGPVTAFKN